jgi:hypothetical protein
MTTTGGRQGLSVERSTNSSIRLNFSVTEFSLDDVGNRWKKYEGSTYAGGISYRIMQVHLICRVRADI